MDTWSLHSKFILDKNGIASRNPDTEKVALSLSSLRAKFLRCIAELSRQLTWKGKSYKSPPDNDYPVTFNVTFNAGRICWL